MENFAKASCKTCSKRYIAEQKLYHVTNYSQFPHFWGIWENDILWGFAGCRKTFDIMVEREDFKLL